jgi:chromosome segregation ATPase
MSIVSENEMREFFQRLIDSVAELSTQASKVDGLEQRLTELSERMTNLEIENRNLSYALQDAQNKVNEVQANLTQTQVSLDNEKAVTQSLRETIIQRDAGVQKLEQDFRLEQDSHKITTSERDDARQKITELEQSLAASKQSYDEVFADRDQWRQKFWDMEKETAEVKQRLGQIQSVLNPLRVVSSDVA